MARPHALSSEIFGSFDESGAEQLLPEAIDSDAGGEGILFFDKPVGEVHTGRDFSGFCERWEKLWGIAGHFLGRADRSSHGRGCGSF